MCMLYTVGECVHVCACLLVLCDLTAALYVIFLAAVADPPKVAIQPEHEPPSDLTGTLLHTNTCAQKNH